LLRCSIIAGEHSNALTLDYYHIELEDHDVVLAEGAGAETYAGDDHYGFDNAEEYERLYGTTVGPKRSFAPVVGLFGGRQELASRLRSAVSPLYDARQPSTGSATTLHPAPTSGLPLRGALSGASVVRRNA
jgi:hypothetical protein